MAAMTNSPSGEDVREALGRILDSPSFHDSPQLIAFLFYIVEETLAGREAELKGYNIATRALGRPDSFDPQTDPIVRVQAGRLRQALVDYYETSGEAAVVIRLARGTYVPRFEWASPQTDGFSYRKLEETAAPVVEQVAKVQQKHLPARLLQSGFLPKLAAIVAVALLGGYGFQSMRGQGAAEPDFTPSVTVESEQEAPSAELVRILNRTRDALARFDDVIIVREAGWSNDARSPASPRLALRLGSDISNGQQARILARLIDRRDQRVLWSRAFEPTSGPAGSADRDSTIVRAIAATVAQPYGVIHAHVRSLIAARGGRAGPYGCLVAVFDYWHVNDVATHADVQKCLLEKAKEFPTASAIHAQLAYVHLEEYRQGYNPMPGDPLERGLESATAAIRHAPASARAYQSLLAVHFARGDMEAAWSAAGEAAHLNPYDTEILQDIGARHVQSGHYEKGLGMLEEALALNPAPPTWALTFRALALYMLGRLDQSGPAVLRLRNTQYPPAMIAHVMAAYQFRDLEGARRSLGVLETRHPAIAANVGAYLDRLRFAPVVRDQVVKDFSAGAAWVKRGGG